MEDLYTVPRGVRLDSDRVRSALAGVGIDSFSYVANGALNHVFLHRRCRSKLSVVASNTTRRLSEVAGDTMLWLTVRRVAADAELSPSVKRNPAAPGENSGLPDDVAEDRSGTTRDPSTSDRSALPRSDRRASWPLRCSEEVGNPRDRSSS
ncbi:hypothetical protein [Saccharopolyspora hattusasensis]|uniref:hypothetical protein n=1 Tax=Saccharopolyspora hattusasensis TaxID=1128679 RepID=UPI003D959F2D